jgi:hypothetical protein
MFLPRMAWLSGIGMLIPFRLRARRGYTHGNSVFAGDVDDVDDYICPAGSRGRPVGGVRVPADEPRPHRNASG